MILFSTPSSITWLAKNQKTIKFFGEWTLEPKFYLDAQYALEIDESKESEPLSLEQIKNVAINFELNQELNTTINSELNQELNSIAHESSAVDVLHYLKDNQSIYDVMVVDPPAFAKSMSKRHNAVQAYKRLNAMALRQITEGGILFTFSCSQVVDRQLFYDTIVAAAIEAGRKVRVMHHLTQPADHPVSMFHPEGSYLKGLVLYVE